MDDSPVNSVAILSLVTRFPNADTPTALWQVLQAGQETTRRLTDAELRAIGIVPEALQTHSYVPVCASMRGLELFDAGFFGVSNREAQLMDPQLRVFLEGAWEALEVAGYDSHQFDGRIGVFGGAHLSSYFLNHVSAHPETARALGAMRVLQLNTTSHVPTLTSYKLDLHGPSVNVQTACSTSLTAVHYACQSLLAGECDMAIAGAVNIQCPGGHGYVFEPDSILSPDGHCRPFDDAAAGTLFTDGLGIVVLRRLEDALAARDNILAVIRGSAINNDGSSKVGYTAPSVQGQAEVIAEAQAIAGVASDAISYVEAHGTGTMVGDPIELTALSEAFGAPTDSGQHCAIGSIKGNIGHANAAAGMAGLAKVVLALLNEEIPPTINCETPTRKFDFSRSRFYLARKATPWKRSSTPRVAGLSSFGMGGTNVHLVIEESPEPVPTKPPRRAVNLLVASARSRRSLDALLLHWAEQLQSGQDAELADLAFTSRHGRRAQRERAAVVAWDRASAVKALSNGAIRGSAPKDSARDVVFMFPGQGSQHAGMGRQLYDTEPAFRNAFDRCAQVMSSHNGADLAAWTFGMEQHAETQLTDTERAQPAVFALSYALAELWQSWGVHPAACIGHSLGEFTAACVAGVLTVDEAMVIVAERGRLMASMPRGVMYAVRARPSELQAVVRPPVEIAGFNAPELCVVTGPEPEVEAWLRTQPVAGWDQRKLRVSHAFHSAMMEPTLHEFERVVRRVATLRAPTIPYVSNVTGTWITEAEARDPTYYAKQLRLAVRFADGLAALAATPDRLFLEVGPGDALSGMSRRQVNGRTQPVVASLPWKRTGSSRPEFEEQAAVLSALGALWAHGVDIRWKDFDGDDERRRLPAPTYPFERRRHWLPPRAGAEQAAAVPDEAVLDTEEARADDEWEPPESPTERAVARIWGELLGLGAVGRDDNFFELGGDSLLVTNMIQRIRAELCEGVPVAVVFETRTVRAFAARIDELLSAGHENEAAEPQARGDRADALGALVAEVGDEAVDDVLSQVGLVEEDR
jgi:acyl transferase domain-containing protein